MVPLSEGREPSLSEDVFRKLGYGMPESEVTKAIGFGPGIYIDKHTSYVRRDAFCGEVWMSYPDDSGQYPPVVSIRRTASGTYVEMAWVCRQGAIWLTFLNGRLYAKEFGKR